MLLNSGLRISEALGLKVSDVRLVDGTAQSVHVIGKGNRERIVPLPEAFGAVFGFWLKNQPRGEFAFARAAGQKPVSSQAARAYRRGMLKQARIDQKVSPAPATADRCTHRGGCEEHFRAKGGLDGLRPRRRAPLSCRTVQRNLPR